METISRILSTHQSFDSYDKRNYSIMALEIAKVIDGQMLEDNKASWLTVEV